MKQQEELKDKVYFKVLYNKEGEIIGVEPPEGREVVILNECDLYKNPLKEVNEIKTNVIISKPGNTPCCIKAGRWLWCWCLEMVGG